MGSSPAVREHLGAAESFKTKLLRIYSPSSALCISATTRSQGPNPVCSLQEEAPVLPAPELKAKAGRVTAKATWFPLPFIRLLIYRRQGPAWQFIVQEPPSHLVWAVVEGASSLCALTSRVKTVTEYLGYHRGTWASAPKDMQRPLGCSRI